MKATKACKDILYKYGPLFVSHILKKYERYDLFYFPVEYMYFVSNNAKVEEIKKKGPSITVEDVIECEIQYFERDRRESHLGSTSKQLQFILEYVIKDYRIGGLTEPVLRHEINKFIESLIKWKVIRQYKKKTV